MTGPAWTVVFPIISGLVTEAGGPMSHPAIVAREFGIPSVVGTGNATRVLRDGQRVRLDGANAVVQVVG
jgi:pyruvate,water dikinase